jgi:hypothetical protein
MKKNVISNKHIADLYKKQQQQTEKLRIEKLVKEIKIFQKKDLTNFIKYNII